MNAKRREEPVEKWVGEMDKVVDEYNKKPKAVSNPSDTFNSIY